MNLEAAEQMGGSRNKKLAVVTLPLILFLICSLSMISGCNDSSRQRSYVDPTGTVPSEKTELELLAEIEKKFENPPAHYELARLYHRAHQWRKAEYHYDITLGFDAAHRAAQAGLVKMYIEMGDTAKAENFANSYISQAGISDVKELLRLAWECEKVSLDDYAMRCFRQALSMAPDSAEVNKQMGFYYLGKGDSSSAKQYLQRSFQLNANQADVAGALGRLGVVVQSPQPEPEVEEMP